MTHSKLSPSSMFRWSRCPGYPNALAELKRKGLVREIEKKNSLIGTAVHKMIELYFEEDINPETFLGMTINGSVLLGKKTKLDLGGVTEEMIDGAKICIDYMEELRKSPELIADYYEKFYSTKCLEIPGLDGGTCDGVFEFKNVVAIVDYKNGSYPVYAKNNDQLLCYAAGHYLNASEEYRKSIDEYHLTIVQPNAHKVNTIDTWVIDRDQLENWIDLELIPSAEATVDSYELIPGDIQCKWCPIGEAGLCKAQADMTKELIKTDFDDIGSVGLPDVETLTIDQLVNISEYENIIKNFIDNAKKRLIEEAKVHKIPRHKWVMPNKKRKFINDTHVIYKEVSKYDIDPFLQKPKAMCEIEKELKKKLNKADLKEVMNKITYKPEGEPVLVLETDKREAIDFDIKSDFDDIE